MKLFWFLTPLVLLRCSCEQNLCTDTLRLNKQSTTKYTPDPRVATLKGRFFVTVWDAFNSNELDDSQSSGIYASIHDSNGVRISGLKDELINIVTSSYQDTVSITNLYTYNSNSNTFEQTYKFVIVWESSHSGSDDVIFRIYEFDIGAYAENELNNKNKLNVFKALTGEIVANSYKISLQGNAEITGLYTYDEKFVIIWQSFNQDNNRRYSLIGRVFDSGGNALTSEFKINDGLNSWELGQKITPFMIKKEITKYDEEIIFSDKNITRINDCLGNNNMSYFIVVWQERPSNKYHINIKILNENGYSCTDAIQVDMIDYYKNNPNITFDNKNADIVDINANEFIVVWQSDQKNNTETIDDISGSTYYYDISNNIVQRTLYNNKIKTLNKNVGIYAHYPKIITFDKNRGIIVCWSSWSQSDEGDTVAGYQRDIKCRMFKIEYIDFSNILNLEIKNYHFINLIENSNDVLINLNDTSYNQYSVDISSWMNSNNSFIDSLFVVVWHSDPNKEDSLYYINGRVLHDNETHSCLKNNKSNNSNNISTLEFIFGVLIVISIILCIVIILFYYFRCRNKTSHDFDSQVEEHSESRSNDYNDDKIQLTNETITMGNGFSHPPEQEEDSEEGSTLKVDVGVIDDE